ncbi:MULTISPECIES: 3'-5' exonuclease [unclassified Dysgonomonas]|uniref:3'-5' exonuclease n=1 Tax=unclassified Dysgonomonas TaxID=2630389 RepID=UPI000681B78D|nr:MULTISPECIES: 3'-5' exonuclease [unclassified Dysgonomonas]
MVSTISKEEISTLPIAVFPGRMIVVQTEKEAQKATSFLEQHKVIGFDTETRPSFKKGLIRTIALMQLSTEDTCFLFRLNFIDIPECLSRILISPDIKKIGLSLKDDFSAIRKRMQLEPKNFIELQSFVKKFGIEDNGLQRIYAILFGEKISKSQRLSNWEADILSEAQQKYASLDAWACLQIYNKLIRLNPSLAEDK